MFGNRQCDTMPDGVSGTHLAPLSRPRQVKGVAKKGRCIAEGRRGVRSGFQATTPRRRIGGEGTGRIPAERSEGFLGKGRRARAGQRESPASSGDPPSPESGVRRRACPSSMVYKRPKVGAGIKLRTASCWEMKEILSVQGLHPHLQRHPHHNQRSHPKWRQHGR